VTAARAAVVAPHGAARLLAGVRRDGRAVSLDAHLARFGRLDADADLIAAVERSGLRGRGGGGFPTGQKLRSVANARGRPVVVLNGAEGEPASGKDKALLRHVPHLVLDGAAAAASALGARDVVVAVGRGARLERSVVSAALAQRQDAVRWRLAAVPDGFVAGEETALLNALEGRAAKPALKPPFPFECGLGGAPTLVQNAETLAHLALIARFGERWFRSLGTETEPGTALVTLSGAVARPGVYEIELGTPLSEVLAQAGGTRAPVGAFLVGGYFGAWTRDEQLQLTAANGFGAGVVFALPASACGLRQSARIARYLADASAGQCGPCHRGLPALATGLERLVAGERGDRRDTLERWARQVSGRGACRHPDGAARFVQSSLSVFADEIALHLRNGRCSARAHRDDATTLVGRRSE
jgi:NADH:ubiquinone oxidoreductase subunit F (NADH-binding)